MTAPSGPILFNSSTGSDTAASGLGPATALTGAGASTTASSAVVTGIDTTGVAAGDLLWVESTSGRQFSIIASVDSGTQVTCDDVFANTEASRTWAIGGKRATFDETNSRTIFNGTTGGKSDWIIETETNQSLTTAIDIGVSGMEVRGASGAIRVINQTANTYCFGNRSTYQVLSNLKFTNSNGTKTAANGVVSGTGGSPAYFIDCILGDATNQLLHGITHTSGGAAGGNFLRCEIAHCTGDGIRMFANAHYNLKYCNIHSNGDNGLSLPIGTTGPSLAVDSCVFHSNADAGIELRGVTSSLSCNVKDSIFYFNGGSGLHCTSTSTGLKVIANVFVSNGVYGINNVQGSSVYADYNAFFNDTAGPRNGVSAGPNDITLTADPFTWSKSLTAVSWTFATKRLNKTGGFAGVHVGQSVNVTGGTGVTPGLYAIASVDSDDQITLVASIAGADTADVTTEPVFNINNHANGGAVLRAATVVLP